MANVRRQEVLFLSVLFLLALLPRLFQLDAVPPGLNGDELYNIIDARRIGTGNWPVYMPGNLGREALFFYLLAFSLRLFGLTIFALRLPSVLLGSGAVIACYLLGCESFNRRVGFTAAALIAVSLWPVMLSRIGLRAISLTFLTTLSLYFLYRSLKHATRRDWLLGGLALGLTMYTYIPSRVFPLVIAAWLGWVWWKRPESLRANRRSLVLSLLLAGAVFAPLGVYMARHPDFINQRIVSMTNAVERAQAGEPEALLASLGGVLKMFSIEGDDEWRYHLAHRPIFDPLTSIFFYLGLALSAYGAFREREEADRQPEYALLLLWMSAMLAPNAVLNENPSSIRAAGAIVPVYILAGLGVDAVYRWLRIRTRMPIWAGSLLLGIGLAITLAYTAFSYFTVWANHPQVRTVYHAEQAMMGRYLEQHPAPPNTRVFVAYDYVYDSPTALGLSLFTDHPVAWFARNDTFPWPHDGQENVQSAWYLVPTGHRLPSDALGQLAERSDQETIRYANGDQAFTIYRLASADFSLAPSHEAALTFNGGPRLEGYDLPNTIYSGENFILRLHWQIPAELQNTANRLTYVQVHLTDAAGIVRARGETLLGYPQAGWHAGDRFVQELSFAVPQGMLPGPATLAFGLRDDSGKALGEMKAAPGASSPLVRSRPLADFSVMQGMTVHDDTLVLTGASYRPFLTPGEALNISLSWVALRRPTQDYRVQLQVIEPGADEPFLVQTFAIWPRRYPPTHWQPLEAVTTLHGLQIPIDARADSSLELHVRVLPAPENGDGPVAVTAGSSHLGELAPDTRVHVFEPPAVAINANAHFGEDIRLLGYDVDTEMAYPGGAVYLTLVWQALATPDENYTVFNHLVGLDGESKGQFDSPPVGEAWLTQTWLPGEVIVEEREIPIESDAVPGPAQLIVGLYTAEDLKRLPVTVDRRLQAGDQLVLHHLEIVSGPAAN